MKTYSNNTRTQELLALAIVIGVWGALAIVLLLILTGVIPSDLHPQIN